MNVVANAMNTNGCQVINTKKKRTQNEVKNKK